MSTSEIRQQLHQYIDKADDKDVAAMYSYMEDKTEQPYQFSEEELTEFYRRRENFIAGKNKGYTVEEAHSFIRLSKKQS